MVSTVVRPRHRAPKGQVREHLVLLVAPAWSFYFLQRAIETQPESELDYSPPNAYGRSKVVGEQLVRRARMNASWTILRPTSIWGPWFGTPYRDFFVAVAAGRYVQPSGPPICKSFGYVGTTVRQLLGLFAAPDRLVAGQTYYLADSAPLSVQALADEIRGQLGLPPVRTVSRSMLRFAALGGDLLQRSSLVANAPLTSFRFSNLITPMVVDISALDKATGVEPEPLPVSVSATLAYLREAGTLL